jgi:hypothetical protein
MQWLQNKNRSNVDNRNNVRHETSRCYRNKNKEYLKVKLMNLTLTVTSEISETCIWARINIVKNEKVYLVADCLSILAR